MDRHTLSRPRPTANENDPPAPQASRGRVGWKLFPVLCVLGVLRGPDQLSADIELRHQVETNVLERVDTAIIGGDLPHELSGTPDHFIKVLDD